MATLSDIRTGVKTKIGREFNSSDMNTVLDEFINMAIVTFGDLMSAVYDEFLYEHTITSAEISAETDSYALPNETKAIMNAWFLEVESGAEDVYYPHGS